MEFTASKIAEIINGKIEGNPKVLVKEFGKIEEAKQGQLSFLANMKYEKYLYTTQASIVIINENFELKEKVNTTLIRVKDSYTAFATLLETYEKIQLQSYKGIDKKAIIASKVKIGKNVYIGPNAIVETGVEIGDNTIIMGNCSISTGTKIGAHCIIYYNVNIYKYSWIGNNVIIHSGAVIGSDGFGFAPLPDGSYKKIPQIGNVLIEDNVEIGSNSTIDRATMGSTIIRKGTKIDNLVQIAHNVEIGENTVIAAQCGIAGSTKIGGNVKLGGQVGIVGHIKIGNNVSVGAKTGVYKSIGDDKSVFGYMSFDVKQFIRSYAHFKNLDNMVQRLKALEKNIKNS
ncbi:UDP-3-O-acylglucosamine N-acyltransferase-like [Rhinoderma darwinii]|uniref:UDP-3-O-acylglucosamine N-acyltransferase-like n=1 Tax=Rhinoderma darwinii TaxID=43563 RepID=UPI003F67174D